MKRLLLILAISSAVIGPQLSCAQTPEIDSLLTVIRTAKEDTHKVNALNLLSQKAGWRVGNYDTAFYYAENGRLLAEKLEFKRGMANSLHNIGNTYIYQGNYSEALKDHLTSLKIKEEINDKRGIASSYNSIGIIYKIQGNYPEALKNYFAALKVAEEIGDKTGIANTNNNIGNIYRFQGKYPEALENYLAALRIQEELRDKTGIAESYNNIGVVYLYLGNYPDALRNYSASLKILEEIGNKKGIASAYGNIGNIYLLQGKYPEALKSQSAALNIREEIGDRSGIAVSYHNIGSVYQSQGNYKEALSNYFASLRIKEDLGDRPGIASSYASIAELYFLLNDMNAALNYSSKELELSKEIGEKELIKHSYQLFSTLDSAQGDYKSAYNNYKLFILYRDSLLNEENIKKTTQLQMQYEFDKKEAIARTEQEKKDALTLKELQKQKLVRNGFVGGFVVMVLFAGVFFTQRNSIKKGKKQSDELLLNILPSEVAEELKLKGHADAQHFDEVTVLFTDFKGFTAMAELLSAKELVEDLNICFSEFDRIMEKYGIEKIKTIGDAYMAAGGLPTPNATHATDVVKAAMEMRDFVASGKARKIEQGLPFFEVRVGVHTGSVVAGIVGIKKFAYDIWGDTVNTASRMESSGEAGKVNISETTYRLVKDQFTCEYRGEIEAKGKGKVKMYFVEQT